MPLFLMNPKLYSLDTIVLDKKDNNYLFDQTIFHLQGGGQPNDKGWIVLGEEKIDIVGGVVDKETG